MKSISKKYYVALFFATILSSLSVHVMSAKNAVLSIKSGEVRILNIKGVSKVALGNPEVVSYKTLDNGQVMLIGQEAGESSVHIWRNGGRELHYWVEVEERYITKDIEIAKKLTKNIKDISIYNMDGRVVVEGKIHESDANIVQALQTLIPDVLLLLTARPFSRESIIRIDAVLVEIGSNDMKKLGIEWDSSISGPSYAFHKSKTVDSFIVYQNDEDGVNRGIVESIPPGDRSFFEYFGITSHILSTINFLENTGKARVLSSPKLSTVSGKAASFHVGGTFPIPVINSLGAVSVEREDYGVMLYILPTIDDDMINLEVSFSLSDIDPSVSVNGVPGTKTRETETVIQMMPNQTVAISGLFAMADSHSNSGIPFLSKIPVIKYLFGVDDKDKESREVVVLLTPKIITPGDDNDRAMSDFAREVIKENSAKLTV
ncbi:MAG: pilus assembly protein N-terminal domain-containing protein, partial [Cellvibrionales bacterium]|nr:pilus assembly protein N-terminal domain-containing protein [Cellvibrionales bacterium]